MSRRDLEPLIGFLLLAAGILAVVLAFGWLQ
jgi:hypothetical protein